MYKDYVCMTCGHEVMATSPPAPIRWTDGHVCLFVPAYNPEQNPTSKEEKLNVNAN